MNISINNINFSGRKEVMYGLNKAANNTRNAETCKALMQGPRPLNKYLEEKSNEAASNAYMLMATYDDSFYSTLKEYDIEELNKLKEILKPAVLQYAKINPLSFFKKTMINSLVQHNKPVDAIAIDDFFKKLEDKPKFII